MKHQTACILCSENCGLEVETAPLPGGGVRLTKIRGDEANPSSNGYLCQKAARLDHYQNHADRLSTPLRRKPGGGFEAISWETAFREIAERLLALRKRRGGHAFAYYGGGGQGNHLGGVYSAGLRAALGTRYLYTALAQEKTGDFWVNGRLFGRQTCHVTTDIASAECVLMLGTNPWQSHGFPEARRQLQALSKDPARRLIVVDPIRTETAKMADVHLQIKPSTDAYLIGAMLAIWLEEGLLDQSFIKAHVSGFGELEQALRGINISDFAARTGVTEEAIRGVARSVACAKSCSVRADLGLQQSLHSTLNSYLEKLLFILSGNFGVPGGNNLHTHLVPLIGHSDERTAERTRVTGVQAIGKLFPPNVLPLEILSEQDDRVRALIVDSANPLRSGADTKAYTRAFEALELLVVIDVAMTETASAAHYVLPASSQFEKWEATFFSLGFPKNHVHLRKPLTPPLPGTLPEPEIYNGLLVAMGELPARSPLLERVARLDRQRPALRLLPAALKLAFKLKPKLARLAPNLLYQTLGEALPEGAKSAAVLWLAAQRYAELHRAAVERAGVQDRGAGLGEALFERILTARSGAEVSHHTYSDVWNLVRHPDRRIHVAIPELLAELRALAAAPAEQTSEYPFTLIAGQRRSYNANTVVRDPAWRRNDPGGALRVHPADARALGLTSGAQVACESRAGVVQVIAELDESLQPGLVVLPHGYGLTHPNQVGARETTGAGVNDLTESGHCDPRTRTPFHKHVAVRLRALAPAT